MQKIEMFKSNDGKTFESQVECEKHEILCYSINLAMSSLNPIPDCIEFSNGLGYVKQNKNIVINAMIDLINVSNLIDAVMKENS